MEPRDPGTDYRTTGCAPTVPAIIKLFMLSKCSRFIMGRRRFVRPSRSPSRATRRGMALRPLRCRLQMDPGTRPRRRSTMCTTGPGGFLRRADSSREFPLMETGGSPRAWAASISVLIIFGSSARPAFQKPSPKASRRTARGMEALMTRSPTPTARGAGRRTWLITPMTRRGSSLPSRGAGPLTAKTVLAP